MSIDLPEVVGNYFAAAGAYDFAALAACFTPDGMVSDEGDVFHGPAEIVSWRETLAAKWINTYEVTSAEMLTPTDVQVTAHLAGTFPGGDVDLDYAFRLADGLIARLEIS
jgi:ketosteroid isomerase-like protein